ncbi:N-acetylneuraminate synthase family protein [Alishewanella sp. HL-SH05]|uniref:N-acetylneuraminate synthase family protein n=1 Tax=Alishewanella sp. HL-SH05 TaxID=3461145 RepID=UPI0040413A0F
MVQFIAEVSSNHARDLARCFKFIDAAADIGCSAVKFQLFKLRELFSTEALAFKPSLLEREAWELPVEFLPELANHCRKREIAFCCTPFYLDAVKELQPYVDFYKIASYELLWDDLLIATALTGKPVILSTGMATIDEINHAVSVLKANKCSDLTLLHCTSAYPTPYSQANLAAINTLKQATGCQVGWSDHTVEPGVLQRAIHHYDVQTIEFHLDLDGLGEEFATGHCWLPEQIGQVISDYKKAIQADGDGDKKPVASELADRAWRADPSDGLRPLVSTRQTLKPAKHA